MTPEPQIDRWLDRLADERHAAPHPVAAYRRDLTNYAGFVAGRKQTLLDCPRETVNAYLDGLKAEGLSASSSARHLSAIRQFHKFLCADGLRGDDPTRIVASPRARRALPDRLELLVSFGSEAFIAATSASSSWRARNASRRRRRCLKIGMAKSPSAVSPTAGSARRRPG